MNCKHCNQKLYQIHPFNSQLDMDICINPECPIKCRPQGTYPNPKNAKMFEAPKGAQSNTLFRSFRVDKAMKRGRYRQTD